MLKNPRFNFSENGSKLIPRRLESQLVDDGDGKLRKTRPIVRDGYKAVPDDADRQILKYKKEDGPFLIAALASGLPWSELRHPFLRLLTMSPRLPLPALTEDEQRGVYEVEGIRAG